MRPPPQRRKAAARSGFDRGALRLRRGPLRSPTRQQMTGVERSDAGALCPFRRAPVQLVGPSLPRDPPPELRQHAVAGEAKSDSIAQRKDEAEHRWNAKVPRRAALETNDHSRAK